MPIIDVNYVAKLDLPNDSGSYGPTTCPKTPPDIDVHDEICSIISCTTTENTTSRSYVVPKRVKTKISCNKSFPYHNSPLSLAPYITITPNYYYSLQFSPTQIYPITMLQLNDPIRFIAL